MALSTSFLPARWRGTTNTDGDVIGVSFDTGASVVRLALDLDSARNLADSLREFLDAYVVRTNSHSDMSSGIPNLDGSPTEGQSV